jgi:transposase InsO family protein
LRRSCITSHTAQKAWHSAIDRCTTRHQPKAHPAADAADAPNADLPKAQHHQAEEESQDLSYLLGGLRVDRPGRVWCADITYLPMRRGFLYLVAIMDWFKRKVLAWRISNTLEVNLCIKALNEALHRFGAPEIMNTDHGSQFTSFAWTDRLIRAVPGSRWTARGAASTTSSWRACGGP